MIRLKYSISIVVLCSTIFITPSDLLKLRRNNLQQCALFSKDSGVAHSVEKFHAKLHMNVLIAMVKDFDIDALNRGECYEVVSSKKYYKSAALVPVVAQVNGSKEMSSAIRKVLVRMRSIVHYCDGEGFYPDGYFEFTEHRKDGLCSVFTFNRAMPTLLKDKYAARDMESLDCSTVYQVTYNDGSKADVKFEKGGWVFYFTW